VAAPDAAVPDPAAAPSSGPAAVAVIMGSDSDLPTLQPAVLLLQRFKVPLEVRVLSAHRTPLEMVAFAQAAAGRGLKVIIAGAGGAAHLPGMVAALTTLPVIGVPVQSKALAGVDSLHSIVQMPAGIPVACVAIGNGTNAGLLAVQILALADAGLAELLAVYRQELHHQVTAKDQRLGELGSHAYLAAMGADRQAEVMIPRVEPPRLPPDA
jgi:5-(carboxyamino)imidazole ribonucleotide mutase